MPEFDKDLLSIQQARTMILLSREAQKKWATATQVEVDRVCEAMADAAYKASERLGRMAAEETGFGTPEHKKIKNQFGSKHVWESIKDIKTVGVIDHDPVKQITKIAWPMGIVAALTPSTNPTSTVMNKSLISIKARNSIIIAPHPSAVNSCVETAKVMSDAAVSAGAPEGLIQCMSYVTLPGTDELLSHKYIGVILATGGSDMVRAAHSKGKPAYGVGPGNVPVYVDRSADLKKAAHYIVGSKAFDHSVICATEQAVIADSPIADELRKLMIQEGAYFASEDQAEALRKTLFHPNGMINAKSVGKSPQFLAQMAGINVPENARIIVVELDSVGPVEPLSREKLTTVLGFYIADGWEAGCDICLDMINFGGRGHSMLIHATDQDIIMRFGLEKPVFRIGVNTMGTLGMIGLTTGIDPSLTLGSGGVGGAITGDNITVNHLFNVKRIAYETSDPPAEAFHSSNSHIRPVQETKIEDIEAIVRAVVKEVLNA
jgi:acetaldehyde dehydrogenase (acetylating)